STIWIRIGDLLERSRLQNFPDGLVDHVAAASDHAAPHDVVAGIELQLLRLFVPEFIEQVDDVARVHLARVACDARRQIAEADDDDSVDVDHVVQYRAFDVATRLDGHVDDYAARPHRLDHVARDDARRRTAEYLRRRDDDVGRADDLLHALPLHF